MKRSGYWIGKRCGPVSPRDESRLAFSMGIGVIWDWTGVQLLAKSGGQESYKDRQVGKFTLQRGLSRLLGMLVIQAVLSQYEAIQHGLPPQIAALLQNWGRLKVLWIDLKTNCVDKSTQHLYTDKQKKKSKVQCSGRG